MRLRTAIAGCVALLVAAAIGSTGESAPARLTWGPPALSDPLSIAVTNANRRLYLDDSRDYRLTIVEPLTRELWIEALGMPAVLPPPEEVRDVKTQEEAAQAKKARTKKAAAR